MDKLPILNSGETQTFKINTEDLFGGSGNTITDTTWLSFIAGSRDSFIDYAGTNGATAVILGATNSDIEMPEGRGFAIISSDNCHLDHGGEAGMIGIMNSESSNINRGFYNTIIGCNGTNLLGGERTGAYSSSNCSSSYGYSSVFVGSNGCFGGATLSGFYSSESSSNNGNSALSAFIASYASNIENGGYYNGFAWTYDSDINKGSAGENMVGIACREVLIDKERAVMIGVSGLTSVFSATTHNENTHTYSQTTTRTYDNGSGSTFTIDWNAGGFQKVSMDADTSLDFTNIREGATYKLLIQNLSTYAITGATSSGYTILCEGGSIPNITNNGTDLCILEVFGTNIYVRHFSNFA